MEIRKYFATIINPLQNVSFASILSKKVDARKSNLAWAIDDALKEKNIQLYHTDEYYDGHNDHNDCSDFCDYSDYSDSSSSKSKNSNKSSSDGPGFWGWFFIILGSIILYAMMMGG